MSLSKSFLKKAGCTVAQFKDNMPSVEWLNLSVKHHEELLSKLMCQNISRKRAHLVGPTVVEHLQALREAAYRKSDCCSRCETTGITWEKYKCS